MFYLTTIKQEKTLIFKRIFKPQTGHQKESQIFTQQRFVIFRFNKG